MSPTHFIPGSGGGEVLSQSVGPAWKVWRRGGRLGSFPGLTSDKTFCCHDLADRVARDPGSVSGQLGVDSAVAVGLLGLGEDYFDDGRQVFPPPGCRGLGSVSPRVVAGLGYFRPPAHGADRVVAFLAVDATVFHAHPDSWANEGRRFFQELGLHAGFPEFCFLAPDLGVFFRGGAISTGVGVFFPPSARPSTLNVCATRPYDLATSAIGLDFWTTPGTTCSVNSALYFGADMI